jgi:hypothetical protein
MLLKVKVKCKKYANEQVKYQPSLFALIGTAEMRRKKQRSTGSMKISFHIPTVGKDGPQSQLKLDCALRMKFG